MQEFADAAGWVLARRAPVRVAHPSLIRPRVEQALDSRISLLAVYGSYYRTPPDMAYLAFHHGTGSGTEPHKRLNPYAFQASANTRHGISSRTC